jgi:hypothetical protein
MGSLDSVLGRGRAVVQTTTSTAHARTSDLVADARATAAATGDTIAPNGGSAAVAAGVLAFSAVGVLVAMRFIFRGAIS